MAREENLPKIQQPSDVTLEPLRDYADVDHLSLVSTQALRRVLDTDAKDDLTPEEDDPNPDAGFNPYDSA